MLVHICCSVDSHFFLQELRAKLPNENLIGFFYDPNIHPYSEYELRYFDVKRSCDKLGIQLIKGEYDYEAWLNHVKGYENEPERGARCSKCFDFRMQKSVELALRLKEKSFTTTLLTSPKKDLEQLKLSMQNALKDYDLEFYCEDFRKNGGTKRQLALAKKDKLYHQNYCGCIYALSMQKPQEQLIKELSSSAIKGEVLAGSIEEKLQIFKKLAKNEKLNIIREKFLNYRLLYAKTSYKDEIIGSRILFYSHFKSRKINLSLNSDDDIVYCNKDEICIIAYKKIQNKFRISFEEFCKKPLSMKQQLKLRQEVFSSYNLSPIIIVKTIPKKIEIIAKSIVFEDTRFILK